MKYLITSFLIVFSVVLSGQNRVSSTEECHHCGMQIQQINFASMAVSKAGDSYSFDAIECLVNFLKTEDETSFNQLLIADYFNNGTLIDATTATYLKSKEIPSPMGAYISGFSSRREAEQIMNAKGGELYNWAELKELFKDSRFGLLDHPDHHHHRPDDYAPIGVMGDHLHHKKGLMLSLRYMNMAMSGNIDGKNDVNDMTIFQNYMVALQTMKMEMYMLGVMYAPSDKLTIMFMQNIIKKSMNLSTMMGMNFSTESQGLGDARLSVLVSLLSKQNSSIHLNTSLNIPRKNINNRDDTPMTENAKLPYLMQLGSGTHDLTLGATAKTSFGNFSFGFQPYHTVPLDKNTYRYQFGNVTQVTAWSAYRLADWISLSLRTQAAHIGKIAGKDADLNPMMVTTADTKNSGGTTATALLGTNIGLGDFLQKIKIGVEYGWPIYQNVNGIQMSQDNTFTVGARYSL